MLLLSYLCSSALWTNSLWHYAATQENLCEQVPPLHPARHSDGLVSLERLLDSDVFKNESIAHLRGAVQVHSESFDDLGPVGEDPRWKVFNDFASYLEATYPLVHKTFGLDRVNTHGLVFTWQGNDTTLKPTLLMAHQDTVPVPKSTLKQWIHPPWSGHYEGQFIWGRGSIDCKSQLTAIMDAAEQLVAHGFQPQRTLILSFGFDEESSGLQGAGHIGRFLEERYGRDSLAVIVDEGSPLERKWGRVFALPAVGEKGYLDVEIIVKTPSGHSSVPPAHTGIGIMSELIAAIENKPFKPRLQVDNPYLGQLQCGAVHGPDFPPKLKRLLNRRNKNTSSSLELKRDILGSFRGSPSLSKRDLLAEEAAKASLQVRYLMQTSQAVDIISGGAKINVLPETTSVKINYRINVGETPADIQQHLVVLAEPVAQKYNLAFHSFPVPDNLSKNLEDVESSLTLFAVKPPQAPAPVTPTHIAPLSPYAILAGTTKAVFGEDIIVAPGIMNGNTDTRHLWNLTKHIFRFGVSLDEDADSSGVHTVNERQAIGAHITGTKWMVQFIRNIDEAAFDH